MSKETLLDKNGNFSDTLPKSNSFRQWDDATWHNIFEELPVATIVSVSRPDTRDFSPMLLSYTIEIQYKQVKWRLVKKASQVLYLHFALKRRALIEEFHEKQEQVREYLQSLGMGDHVAVVEDADEPDDGAVPVNHDELLKNRSVPSIAALPIIRPALGWQQSIAETAKLAMQGYLNHFLGNMDIVNSREVCKFLEISRLSFMQEYGPKLKEGYVTVKHLSKISRDSDTPCFPFTLITFCSSSWQKVWAVLKPGFLALLEDPFDTKPLDVIVFDVQQIPKNKGSHIYLASPIKEHNPLRDSFNVSCGNRNIKFRTSSSGKVKDWVAAINDTAMRHQEGWCNPHRFRSFAPPRGLTEDGSEAQWFVDGHTAFEAIASAIENAKSEIFITGWWLCPELYLRRPFENESSSRLDALLEAKARQGVQIYILLYKEVSLALKINSLYSKKLLLTVHENVRVMRYPDHISTGVYLWSHHEKLVIVDYQICFIGGLDLCFGRYDTSEHKVGDLPAVLWPGKDYYNPRESEPNSWEDAMKDELVREKYPRMPWHDVHCAIWGPPCRDVARHFVQRWNHRSKAPNEQAIPLLMPHHHMVLPHYMGRSEDMGIETKYTEENCKDICRQDSFSSQSPMDNIPLLLPQESGGLVATNGVKKVNGLEVNGDIHNHTTEGNGSFTFSRKSSKVESRVSETKIKVDPMDPTSDTDLDLMAQSSTKSSEEFSDTSEEGDHGLSCVESGQVGPRISCHCQIIRSVSQWSAGTSQTEESIHDAYCSLIHKAEHFIYIENQFFISGFSGDEMVQNRVLEALYRRILLAHKEQKPFRVIIVIPLMPGFQGGVDDGGAATVRALIHWQYRTISREKTSILYNLNLLLGPKTKDYISFYGLRSYGRLSDNGHVATSQVYVHSKLLIVDDHTTIIGSSNINDRSLLGSRDSEIGVVIEDKEFLESSMNGEPWKAGKFAHSLRCSLWLEHLGLHEGESSFHQINKVHDPVADLTYRDLWMETAEENTNIYEDVFACIPNDQIHSRAALRQSTSHWKEKIGHSTIDLGIAPEKLEYEENGEIKVAEPMERLRSVKGHLVCFPLEFMREEDLRPFFSESEFYASPMVFL
ncbi:hypothetical protein ACFE04_026995 [Oxalis oulophora]